MGLEDCLLIVFAWLIPNGVIGLLEGFSEQFTYELDGCEPRLAPWLRYGFLQYMLFFFIFMYLYYMPRKYSIYFGRFMNHGATSFFLSLIFMVMQVLTPWITLTLYLVLRKQCNDRITQGQAAFYWILFSLQVVVFIIASVILYFFCGVLGEILDELYQGKRKKVYSQKVQEIIRSREDKRTAFGELLSSNVEYRYRLLPADLPILKVVLGRRMDSKCVEVLKQQHRICFTCTSDFKIGEVVHFMEHCCHIAHWECFKSFLVYDGQCFECKIPSVFNLKRSISNGPLIELEKLIEVPPCIKPTSLEQKRGHNAMPVNPAPQPILTIEYFNYTVDQKTGGEPAEALPAPVAETEI